MTIEGEGSSPEHLSDGVCFFPSALQEAQEIFGVDFDYDEFEKYNEYDEDLEDEYVYEPEEAEGEIRVRPKKTTKKRVSRRSIFEMYEPSELESSHLTDQDNEIRVTDMPERFQVKEFMLLLVLPSPPPSFPPQTA